MQELPSPHVVGHPNHRAERGTRPRIGRPPRIDLDAIARAVIEVGFADVTMKSAAEHLGVSVPGLYHYVNGKDDLIRVAADYQLATLTPPVYDDQDWATWLAEWAHHTYRALSSRPELFDLYVSDELDEARTMHVIGSALGPLLDMGFTPRVGIRGVGDDHRDGTRLRGVGDPDTCRDRRRTAVDGQGAHGPRTE